MSLAFHNVSHAYGSTQVLQDISLNALEGEILCLLGPSGGGKSTLLRLAAGLERLQHGRIDLDGAELASPGSEPPPEARPVGMVFQDHILFPHLTVSDNIRFGLQQHSASEQQNRCTRWLAEMDLAGLGKRFPHELSGGQQQRVALARAMAPEPRVLLLDEPFASVDSTLRRQLRSTTRRALKATGTTAIVVTHDPDEAMALADSIAIMTGGSIAQHATPEQIWQQPATLEVAGLFGDAQVLAATVSSGVAHCWLGSLPCALGDGQASLAVRPEAITLHPASATTSDSAANATVTDVRLLGNSWQVHISSLADQKNTALVQLASAADFAPGQQVCAELLSHGSFAFEENASKTK